MLISERGNDTCEDSAVFVTFRHDLVGPLEIRFASRETRDELGTRHAALFDHRMQNLTLDLTHFVHLSTQRVTQTLDGTRGEADGHQLVLDRFLSLQVRLRLVAFLLERTTHLVE